MFQKLSLKFKLSTLLASLLMMLFFILKIISLIGTFGEPDTTDWIDIGIFVVFTPLFIIILDEIFSKGKQERLKKKAVEEMLNESCLVSRTDRKGLITEVNDKFCEVSGYKRHELLGQDHKMLNSGHHPKHFWTDMYQATVKYKSIWHEIIRNKRKDGSCYVVNSWITGNFDEKGELVGFTSVRQDITELMETLEEVKVQQEEVKKQNAYLEHAAKILRHDMHSGINTYMPRGIKSLKRRLTAEKIKELKIEAPLKMIEEGLKHSQKVYNGVKEFTNLVKADVILNKETHDLKSILNEYLRATSYNDQVNIQDLITTKVNEPLFCTAIDNLIRNGLKYNDSKTKQIDIYMEDPTTLIVQDNGRGMTQEEFEHLSKPYTRREDQKEAGTGLGLNICVAILKEHGFGMSCEKNKIGTKIKIYIK